MGDFDVRALEASVPGVRVYAARGEHPELSEGEVVMDFDDDLVTVSWSDTGHSGPGYYAWLVEYPDEGSVQFDDWPTREQLIDCGLIAEAVGE